MKKLKHVSKSILLEKVKSFSPAKLLELWQAIKVPFTAILEAVIGICVEDTDLQTMLLAIVAALIIIIDAVITYISKKKGYSFKK